MFANTAGKGDSFRPPCFLLEGSLKILRDSNFAVFEKTDFEALPDWLGIFL
jgi:hypothetical protein